MSLLYRVTSMKKDLIFIIIVKNVPNFYTKYFSSNRQTHILCKILQNSYLQSEKLQHFSIEIFSQFPLLSFRINIVCLRVANAPNVITYLHL